MDGAFRRTALVLLLYAAGAWLVLLLGGWLRRVLVLPMSFDALLRWGLWLGVPVAALLAWFYPSLGLDGAGPGGTGRGNPEEREGGGGEGESP